MTRRSLKPDQPLLVGDLVLNRPPGPRGRPHLTIRVWCPYCKGDHIYGWMNLPFRGDLVTHRSAHCHRGSPFKSADYHIGLDPGHAAHNRRVIGQAEAALADHFRCARP